MDYSINSLRDLKGEKGKAERGKLHSNSDSNSERSEEDRRPDISYQGS